MHVCFKCTIYIFTYAGIVFVWSIIHIDAHILFPISIYTLLDSQLDVTDCFIHSWHIKQKWHTVMLWEDDKETEEKQRVGGWKKFEKRDNKSV